MIFSRIGRSLPRSSCSTFIKSVISGNYAVRNESVNVWNARVDGGLGLVRGYLTSIGAGSGRKIVSQTFLSELDSVFVNPRLRRLFCSKAPKRRNCENYFPKNKKAVPKGKGKKSDSEGKIIVNHFSDFEQAVTYYDIFVRLG